MTVSKETNEKQAKPNSDTKRNGQSRYDRANIVSQIYCWYVFPFLYRYYKKDFDLDVLGPCPKADECERLGNKLKRYWHQELIKFRAGKAVSLTRALIKCFGCQFLVTNLKNILVYGGFRMIMPMILGRIIHYSNRYFEQDVDQKVSNGTTVALISHEVSGVFVSGADDDFDLINSWFLLTARQNVILYSFLLGLVIFVNVIVAHPYFFTQFRYGMNIRVGVTRLVYEKALKVTNQAVQRISVGKIVNLISTDANRFDIAYIYVGFVYCALIETAVGVYFMYRYIGRSCLGSLALVLVYIPFQTIMANILSQFRSKSIMLTDDRLRLMAEILPAMRVIKMYVWERPFSRLVNLARKMEISKIRHSMILRSINLALYFVAPKVIAFVCLILFLLDGGKLNAENVFVTLALVAQIRDVITYMFPLGISYGVESYISIKRIEKFLIEDELEDNLNSTAAILPSRESQSFRIALDRVSVSSELDGSSILKDISFEVVPGKLTVIIGPVGSGKSSVLLSILNELPVSGPGSVQVNGRMIYSSQEAWIFSGTVRDNILFGREFEPIRYREVVKVAALTKDFQQFDDGDQTVVEDRGTSLSGGQRARISLARALYTDADCYLLDDPLSAVDASVAKHIFEKCIKQYLKSKCVILVTHQLQFIKQADQIVVLKDGACLACGSYMELLNKGIDVFKYSVIEQDKQPAPEPVMPDSPLSPPLNLMNPLLRFRVDSFSSDLFSTSRTNSFIESDSESTHESILDYINAPLSTPLEPVGDESDAHKQAYNLESTSENSKGNNTNKLKIYWIYTRAGAGILGFSVFFLSNIITQVLFTGSDYWLSAWTDFTEKEEIASANANYTFDRNPIISDSRETNIYIYSGLVALLFLFSIVRTISYFVICMRSSVNLHNRIFSSLIQAPIMFFDKTPIGVIMNRVSRDLGIIDDLLPPTAFEAIEIIGNSLGVFILCTVLNYFIIFPFLILMVLIYFANRLYVDTARKLKRLEGVARSPLFNQMASTLAGLTTIRSYGVEQMFVDRFSQTQDAHTSAYFTFISASRIYGIFLEFVCVAYIYCLIVVMNVNLDAYTGSIIGLTISQSLLLTNTFNWGVRQYTEVETYMTSVERIAEFGQLDKEELDACQVEPEESWPARGDIEYEDVSLMYSNSTDIDEPPKTVLNELSFSIQGGEKIGIVGRTGAGKSSLIVTLFRLTQPSGAIRIDGLDTAAVSLSRLRRSLSIIPQEPILFSGNIRRNLDPFNEKTDEQLWDAIEKVQLKAKISSLPAKLDSPVSECGSDFSVGQKQLICLARAIIRSNRILILDEATANVDPRTDAFIQQAIRSEFANCTVLTIAHRLNTIIDYDRVMVLDGGALAQFDTPYNLIKQKSGIFYELYSNLNQDTRVELKRLAKRVHLEKEQSTSQL